MKEDIIYIAQAFSVIGYNSSGDSLFMIDNLSKEDIKMFLDVFDVESEWYFMWENIFRYVIALHALKICLHLKDKELKLNISMLLRHPDAYIRMYGMDEKMSEEELSNVRIVLEGAFKHFFDDMKITKKDMKNKKNIRKVSEKLAYKFMKVITRQKWDDIEDTLEFTVHDWLSIYITNNFLTFPESIEKTKKILNLK